MKKFLALFLAMLLFTSVAAAQGIGTPEAPVKVTFLMKDVMPEEVDTVAVMGAYEKALAAQGTYVDIVVLEAPAGRYVDVVPLAFRTGEINPDMIYFQGNTDGPVVKQRHHRRNLGMEAVHKGFHELEIAGISGIGHGNRIGGRRRQGLLAEHMLAGAQGAQRPLGMHGIGQGNINGVDVRIVQQRVIAAVAVGDVVAGGIAKCALCLEAGNTRQFGIGEADNGRHKRRPPNIGRAEDAPTDSICHVATYSLCVRG